jgi:hypothetical protein
MRRDVTVLMGMTELASIAVILIQGASLISLRLRLLWRVKQQAARRNYVIPVLQALPDDIEINERRKSGAQRPLSHIPDMARTVNHE